MKKGKSNLCSLAIIKTLSYSGVFNYPLTFHQIINGLISTNRFSPKKIKKELLNLKNAGIIKKTKGRYILTGIKTRDVEKRKKYTSEVIERNKPVIKILAKIPWIKMIAITGSVANQNADKEDDIDLLFITETNKLWITRGFVFLILKILGRLPKNLKDREICPNIFVDERNMGWKNKKRNLYIAHNIISMQPFVWRDDIYFDFMYANRWINKYFVNFKINSPFQEKRRRVSNSFVMKFVETMAKKSEISYMKEGMTTEVVNDKLIHFNKNDSSKKILKKYKILLKKIKNS